MRENLSADAILCNGAGGFAAWIHRFYRFRRLGTHFAPVSQSMGYGVPAAVALKRLYPERPVIAISGDGDFLMSGQEFSTAVQYGPSAGIICLVLDNSDVRLHPPASGKRHYPGRVSATSLVNPDFAALARAAGGFRRDGGEELWKILPMTHFRAAEASGLPAIIHVKYDSDGVAPGVTLSGASSASRWLIERNFLQHIAHRQDFDARFRHHRQRCRQHGGGRAIGRGIVRHIVSVKNDPAAIVQHSGRWRGG